MRLRAQREGEHVVLKVLMAHPMETGRAKDGAGQPIAAWFIEQVELTLGAEPLLSADWGPAVAKNPYLRVELRQAATGEVLHVRWRDNRGGVREDSITLP